MLLSEEDWLLSQSDSVHHPYSGSPRPPFLALFRTEYLFSAYHFLLESLNVVDKIHLTSPLSTVEASYNLLLTSRWMMLVPRSRGGYLGMVDVNGMGKLFSSSSPSHETTAQVSTECFSSEMNLSFPASGSSLSTSPPLSSSQRLRSRLHGSSGRGHSSAFVSHRRDNNLFLSITGTDTSPLGTHNNHRWLSLREREFQRREGGRERSPRLSPTPYYEY